MAINNADKKAAREATLQDLLDSFAGGGSADNAPVVAKLTEILTELQGVLDVDGTVELGSTTVSNLQSAFTTSLATNHTDLQGIAGELNDIYAELLQKFEAGQDIGLSGTTMDALATAIATLFHYPTDYPNAQAHTDAAAVLAALVTIDAVAAATNTKLDTVNSNLLTIDAAITASNAKLDTLHTDSTSILAAVTQTNYLLDDTAYSGTITAADSGTTSTTVSSGDTVITGTPTANSYVSFTLTKDATAQVTLTPSTFSVANVVFDISNDGSTWFRTSLVLHDGTRITSAASGASGHVSVTGYSYFRVRATQYTGGNPITVNVVESARPAVVKDARTAEILAAISVSNVKLDTLHTDSSSVYARLGSITIANTVTVSGTVTTTPPSHASTNLDQINGTTVDTNSGNKSAGTQRVVIATDQPTVPVSVASNIDGTQSTKITDPAGAALTLDTRGQLNMVPVSLPDNIVAFSAIAATTAWQDASGFLGGIVEVTTLASGTWSVEYSNDGTNLKGTLPLITAPVSSPVTPFSTGNTIGGTGSYFFPILGRYVRLTRSAGTLTATLRLTRLPLFTMPYTAVTTPVTESGTWNVGITGGSVAPATSINGATSATTGSTTTLGNAMANSVLQVVVGGTGSFSALTVLLEGSLDGVNFYTLGTMSTASGGAVAGTIPSKFIRARTTVATVGSLTPTITATVGAAS